MKVNKIGVVGAGMMGSEIALCFARTGYDVVMSDTTKELADNGKKKQESLLNKSIAKGKLEADKKDEILARVKATGNIEDMADCDFIVEAVLENYDIKAGVYKYLDRICKPECIIASNTSSISITKLAAAVPQERARKFVGTHYFSPASVMKLVEVIPGILTDDDTIETASELMKDIGKEPISVKDVMGFAVNRMFHAFELEACRLVEEGIASPEDIDKACMLALGHPMGIFKLLDSMDLRLTLSVDEILFEAYGDRFRPSRAMKQLCEAGLYGTKTGRGFLSYEKK